MLEKDIKQSVMRRVYIAYTLRKVFSPVMLKVYIGAVLVWQLASSVSLSNVFANIPSVTHPTHLYNYVTFAFLNTELWVQVIVSAFILLLVWFSIDLIKRGNYGIQNKVS